MDKKPTIVNISAYYPPHIGGMEMVAQEIALRLAHKHFPIIVLTSKIASSKKMGGEPTIGYDVRRLASIEFAHTPILWALPFHLLSLPKGSILHVHIAQAGIPEVAWLISKIRRFPFVAHFHLDIGPSGALGGILPFYKKHFLARVLRGANKVIVFSEEQSKLVQSEYGVKLSNIAIIPNGVGEKFFGEKRNTTPTPLKILSVSRLDAQKRVDRLIEMMSFLKIPAHLTIVGDGELREKLETLVKNLNLANVSFEGKKKPDELPAYYRNSDLFVTSSDREGMSLVALEAMASGLPIIGSNVLGTRELIRNVGILVDEPYPENFAETLMKLARDPREFQKLSMQSIAKARQYSWEKLIEKLEMVYKEIAP